MLPQKYRLTQSWQITHAWKKGRSLHSRWFVLNWIKKRASHPRFAFVASKKVGNAVERNRALRVIRESVRVLLEEFPAEYDYVFVARKGVGELKMDEVKDEIRGHLWKIKSPDYSSKITRHGFRRPQTKL